MEKVLKISLRLLVVRSIIFSCIIIIISINKKSEANLLDYNSPRNFLAWTDTANLLEEEETRDQQNNTLPVDRPWDSLLSFWNSFVPSMYEIHPNYPEPGEEPNRTAILQNITAPLVNWWDAWMPSKFHINASSVNQTHANQTHTNVSLSESLADLVTTFESSLPWPFSLLFPQPQNNSLTSIDYETTITIADNGSDYSTAGVDDGSDNSTSGVDDDDGDDSSDNSQNNSLLQALTTFWKALGTFLDLPSKLIIIPVNLVNTLLPDNPLNVTGWCLKYRWRFCVTVGFGARKCCTPLPCPNWNETTCDPNFRRSEDDDDDYDDKTFSLIPFMRAGEEEE